MKQPPFKVLCVGALEVQEIPQWAKHMDFIMPVIGEEYTVIEVNDGEESIIFYTLAERAYEQEFDARAFATLPDEDQEVGIEHEHEAIIYQR